MASQPASFKIEVKFRRREDSGLEASCEKLPAFFLSHSDPVRVLADVEPALMVILSSMYGIQMRVERLFDLDEPTPAMPPELCGSRDYVGLSQH